MSGEAETMIGDAVILALWHQRLDTCSIASHLGLPESQVHNRLLHIRERDFRDTFGAESAR
jgi:hypothetical protein